MSGKRSCHPQGMILPNGIGDGQVLLFNQIMIELADGVQMTIDGLKKQYPDCFTGPGQSGKAPMATDLSSHGATSKDFLQSQYDACMVKFQKTRTKEDGLELNKIIDMADQANIVLVNKF